MRHIMKIQKLQLFLFFFVLVCIGVYGDTQKPAGIDCRMEDMPGYKTEPFVPVLDITRLTNSPIVDGVINADEWAGAAAIDNFLVPETTSNAMPATKCRLGFDNNALYLAFRCELNGTNTPRAVTKAHDSGQLFYDDSIEMFFMPDGSHPDYYQVAVNSLGASYDAKYLFNNMVGTKASSDLAWSHKWEIGTKQETNAWTMEVAIPWKTWEVTARGIKAFRFNFCRNAIPAEYQYSSWAWLPKLDFQAPERFGIGVCSFDASPGKVVNLAETGLGLVGMCRVEALGGDNFASFSNKIEIIYTVAFPSHPLLLNQKYAIQMDMSGLDLTAWKLNPAVQIGQFDLPPAKPQKIIINNAGEGANLFNLRLLNAGSNVFSGYFFPGAMPLIAQKIRQADLPVTAQKEPFKILGYAGALADIEKTSAIWMRGWPANPLLATFREINARFDVTEKGKTDAEPGSLLALLNLAGAPEAQVVVEYMSDRAVVIDFSTANQAGITYYWGSIPLCCVQVRQFSDKDKARETVTGGGTNEPKAEFEDNPASVSKRSVEYSGFNFNLFEPARHILVVNKGTRGVWSSVVNIDHLDALTGSDPLKADCVVILPDCPSNVHEKVRSWSTRNGLKIVPLEEAMTNKTILLAGDYQKVKDKLGLSKRIGMLWPAKETIRYTVARGKQVFSIWNAPSKRVAEMALHLTMAGKPVPLSEVDALRKEIVKTIAPKLKSKALPEGLYLFCGDTHMHTTYSDGQTPPVATALQTIYCTMDFAVMSDHNRIDSAVLAQKTLKDYGISYPLIVGEEITTKWAHLNAYPLKEVIAPTNTPADTTAAAHAQNAIIQWNHPGFTDSEFESKHIMTGLAGTDCDAWEHYTPLVGSWKKIGALPTLVGSSDSHNGTFGGDERTMILAPAAEGNDLAEAVRKGKTVLITPYGPELFYGSDEMLALAWSALKEGTALKAEKAERLKNTLKNADIIGLFLRAPDKNQR